MITDIQTGNLQTSIIELFNPVYDIDTNTLTYSFTAANMTTTNLPSDFGRSILVIDTTSDNKTDASALCAGCGGRQCPPC